MPRGGDKFDGFSSCIPAGLANNSARLARAAGVCIPLGSLSFIFHINALKAEGVVVCGTGATGERLA